MKAIIAGTAIENIIERDFKEYDTKYGSAYAAIDGDYLYILRHGKGHAKAPHLINYRANAALLEEMDVSHVITTHAVGSITERLLPTCIGLVSDFIDFTYGRPLSFFDGVDRPLDHKEMSSVFDDELKFQVNSLYTFKGSPEHSRAQITSLVLVGLIEVKIVRKSVEGLPVLYNSKPPVVINSSAASAASFRKSSADSYCPFQGLLVDGFT